MEPTVSLQEAIRASPTARAHDSPTYLCKEAREASESSESDITDSQNGRGWKRPLWVIQSNLPAEAGLPRAG